MAKSKFDNILDAAFGISGGYNFHEAYLDEATQINEEKLKFLDRTSRSKIEFENGSSISFHSADDKNAGRGLRPFVPHPCQEEEFALHQESISLSHYIIDEMQTKMTRDFNEKLEIYLKKNISSWGYNFKTQEEFYSFIKTRVSRVIFDELQEVHYYIDFVDLDNRGMQIGLTNENRVSFDFDKENMKFTATIG